MKKTKTKTKTNKQTNKQNIKNGRYKIKIRRKTN